MRGANATYETREQVSSNIAIGADGSPSRRSQSQCNTEQLSSVMRSMPVTIVTGLGENGG